MKKIFILVLVTIVAPLTVALASDLECNYEPAQPADIFIQETKRMYPDLEKDQVPFIAHLYQIAYNQTLIMENEEFDIEAHSFASRAQNIAMRMVAVQLLALEATPEMKIVLEKMEAEEAAGLKKISAELLPDVRGAARKTLAIIMNLHDLGSELTKLNAEHFVAKAKSPEGLDNPLEEVERVLCTFESVVDLMSSIEDYLPQAIILASVKNLYY